jgi:hypothetical protein
MLSDLARRLADVPGLPSLVEQRRRFSPDRVAPGRFEYSFVEFVIFAVVLLGLTFLGLRLARSYREKRDERLTASSGGWRIRSQLDIDAGSPYNRFSGLALRMPHDVMEGQEHGFEVAYFRGHLSKYSRDVPHALVQLPVDPPRLRFVAPDTPGAPIDGWGPRAAQVLSDARGVVVETAPLALMVFSNGASPEDVGRIALALAKAVVEDAQARGQAAIS